MHSTYSDGKRDVEFIVKQAKKAGLKWIIITDHNNMDAKKYEGFHDGVCVIVGCEITPPLSNHLLAFGINEPISYEIGERNYIDEVHKQGGICFVAHPDENIHRDNRHTPLRWSDWSIDTFDGLEIWNYLTDWTDRYSTKKSIVWQYFYRHKNMTGPTKNLLAWWDRLNNSKERIVPAIGGLDAHAFGLKKIKLPFFISDYYDFFKALNNIVYLNEELSEDFSEAKSQIISALKNANSMIINRFVSSNTNIEIFLADKNEKIYFGDFAKVGQYSRLICKLPKKGTIRIFHNGVLIYEKETKVLEFDNLSSGKYRIEVFDKTLPWIFTNPIKIEI